MTLIGFGDGEFAEIAGESVPAWLEVAERPLMVGSSCVWPAVSPAMCGKSDVRTAVANPSEGCQFAGTPFEAPSVNSTMIRRLDCDPPGTLRSSSQPR